MKKIVLLLFIASLCFGQARTYNEGIFYNPASNTYSTADTIGSITSKDSVYVQFHPSGAWNKLTATVNDTAYITADDKSAENVIQFRVSAETYFTATNQIRFQFRAATVDTATSNWIYVGGAENLTLDVVVDTIGAATHYGGSMLRGN